MHFTRPTIYINTNVFLVKPAYADVWIGLYRVCGTSSAASSETGDMGSLMVETSTAWLRLLNIHGMTTPVPTSLLSYANFFLSFCLSVLDFPDPKVIRVRMTIQSDADLTDPATSNLILQEVKLVLFLSVSSK